MATNKPYSTTKYQTSNCEKKKEQSFQLPATPHHAPVSKARVAHCSLHIRNLGLTSLELFEDDIKLRPLRRVLLAAIGENDGLRLHGVNIQSLRTHLGPAALHQVDEGWRKMKRSRWPDALLSYEVRELDGVVILVRLLEAEELPQHDAKAVHIDHLAI